MTRPTSRVLQLLELLQSAGTCPSRRLAEQLGVDERTVRRYVMHLIELDIPVQSVRGRYGGYRIAPGYRMPPLMFTDDEALAVLLGLVALRATPLSGVSDTANVTATGKLRRALPERLGRRARTLLDNAEVIPPASGSAAPDAEVLLTVAEAVEHHRPLAIRYRTADGTRSARGIHPYGLTAYQGRWYLTALDIGQGAERAFRLDRITDARATLGTFRPPARPGDAAQRLLDRFAVADYEHRVTLRVQAEAAHIRARLPPSVAILEPIGESSGDGVDPWFRIEIRAVRLDWIPGVIAALDRPVVIEQPDELRELVARLGAVLAAVAAAS